jgi:hypothetical protein
MFPDVMTKALVFIPVIGVGFVLESFFVQKIADHFRLSNIEQETKSAWP